MTRTITQCGRMDHGGCTLSVESDGNRITGITPIADGPLSAGHICPKARALKELHEHPARLTMPLRRIGERGSGRWEEISWDEALGFAAEKLDAVKAQHGARAVAFCQGAPKGLEHFIMIRLANTFGSPNVVGPQNVCHMPREIAGVHTCGFFPVADYSNPSEAVLVWGSNLTATNEEGVICTRLLGNIKANPAPLIVVDPRRTELAARADIHLPVKPGTDLALALGFLNVVLSEELYDREFVDQYTHGLDELASSAKKMPPEKAAEICGVDPSDLVKAARIFGKARPGLIQWGNGIEQNEYNYDTARALLALMAVCGNLDRPGGNIAAVPPKTARLGEFVRGDLCPGRAKEMISAGRLAPGFMIVPPEHLKQAVKTGDPYPVRAAYVHVSNPVLAWSDSRDTVKTLKSLDFLVVTETFMTPTAALADVVFPAATHLEFNDLGHFGLAHGFVLARPKAVEPPGECRPPFWILNDLGRAMGMEDLWWEKPEAMLDDILAPSGLTYSDLVEKRILRGGEKFYKYREKGFKTPTGRVELALSKAEKFGLPAVPQWRGALFGDEKEYPLTLIGHKSRHFFCSDHRYLESLRSREPEPLVEIHPETAVEYDIKDGDPVRIETGTGMIQVRASITPNVPPGVISVVHGWWLPEAGPENESSWSGSSLNMLTNGDRLGKAMGAPNLRAVPAKIRATHQ